MKILTLTGTRPELIRLSVIMRKLDEVCDHIHVHTMQNYDPNLYDIFMHDLGIRKPNYIFQPQETLGTFLGEGFQMFEQILDYEKPDKILILGDTNSALLGILAERMGIPVYHMESANRNYNREVPEEVNRRLLDHVSSYNLFYTETNRHTLLQEGLDPKKIFQCGNPTLEVLTYYQDEINQSRILHDLGLMPHDWPGIVDPPIPYFLVDIHRAETVNNIDRLEEVLRGLNYVAEHYDYPVICSIHPRTRDKLKLCSVPMHEKIKFLDAFGYFDFVKLEKHAKVGLTDSGLCSEEYCILKVPCVIVRNETERPEVVEAGGALISGINANSILDSVKKMIGPSGDWQIPDGYGYANVSDKVVNYILGKVQ